MDTVLDETRLEVVRFLCECHFYEQINKLKMMTLESL